jgi:hypothetical protein
MITLDKRYRLNDRFEKRLLLGIVFLGVLCGCQSESSCHKVLNAKCIRCHSASTSCAKMGQSEQWWLRTIDTMVKLRADVTKQERKILAKCLSNPSEAVVEKMCK